METPIFDTLKKYASTNPKRFHMPGHKGKAQLFGGLGSALTTLDVTELDETDNLANPQGAIALAQEKLAFVCGAQKSFMLSGGSTLGNLAMLYAAAGEGEKILIDRSSHISVFSALSLSGAKPIYINGGIADKCGALRCPSVDEVRRATDENPDAKAVFITTPNSFGITAPLREIAQICHEHNMYLLVDEAHGAHFTFHNALPKTAMQCGADACVQSFHKTLPSLTQSAVLHIGNMKIAEKTEKALRLFQSSSPSYLLTASVDWARAYMEEYGEKRLCEVIDLIKQNEPHNALKIADKDITRLCIKCDGAKSVALLKDKNIVPEMTGISYAVFIITVFDSDDDIKYLLRTASSLPAARFEDSFFGGCPAALTPRQAYFAEPAKVSLADSCGSISKNAVFRYPPGVPVIAPGEIITREAIDYITVCSNEGDSFTGIENGMVTQCQL